ncbi:hypothetical protein [Shimia abyssi]|uniref:Uncharacterized protein n=1 Tax=Shimia abyssi TaxID=1662395 RepID=A0A2P8EU85_9RHOB|nr:hypothetical protein [Shimia abyssi]PSL13008.1 hypothetical protein CLV88_13610 [Shimia abyssi]
MSDADNQIEADRVLSLLGELRKRIQTIRTGRKHVSGGPYPGGLPRLTGKARQTSVIMVGGIAGCLPTIGM